MPTIHTRINRVFRKKPASGGRPPRDKRHRAKERFKKRSFITRLTELVRKREAKKGFPGIRNIEG